MPYSGRFLSELSRHSVSIDVRIVSAGREHTQSKQASEEETKEEQGEAELELRVLADGRVEGLARGSLPEIVEWCCRH